MQTSENVSLYSLAAWQIGANKVRVWVKKKEEGHFSEQSEQGALLFVYWAYLLALGAYILSYDT